MAKKRNSVTQKQRALEGLFAEKRSLFSRQGSVRARFETYNGHRLGPYYSLVWRERGRQRVRYLGRSEELAEWARQQLARLQAPHQERRRLARQLKVLGKAIRRAKAAWDRQLADAGYRLHGYEVRSAR